MPEGDLTGFDITDYTAEELAELGSDPTTLQNLLKDLNVGSKKRKFFAKFDETEIADIMASFESKMKDLTSTGKAQVSELKGEMFKSTQEAKALKGRSGLTSGNPMAMFKDASLAAESISEKLGSGKEGLKLGQEQEKKSAYKKYEDDFMDMYGMIKG